MHSLLFKDWPLVAVHPFDVVIIMVSSFQVLLLHTLIPVGFGANSGRATFNSSSKLEEPDPNVEEMYHALFAGYQYK